MLLLIMLNSRNFATYIVNGGEDVCVVDTDADIHYIRTPMPCVVLSQSSTPQAYFTFIDFN